MDLSSLINIHDLQINIYDMVRMNCRKQMKNTGKEWKCEENESEQNIISFTRFLLVHSYRYIFVHLIYF